MLAVLKWFFSVDCKLLDLIFGFSDEAFSIIVGVLSFSFILSIVVSVVSKIRKEDYGIYDAFFVSFEEITLKYFFGIPLILALVCFVAIFYRQLLLCAIVFLVWFGFLWVKRGVC